MERRGIRVDLEYCRRSIEALKGTEADLAARAEYEWGVKRLGSDQQVINRLKQDGVVFTRFTEKGRESLDEEALELINHPLAALVKEYRHARKIAGTYFENYIELADGDLLHPSVNQLGAKTGRMSVSRPSMQNLERSALVRDAFIAREDHVLLLVDYDTIEYRLFAHYAGMTEILEAARAGVDMHTRTAQQIYQKEEISKDERSLTKNATYAKLYGAGAPQFSRTAKVSETQGTAFYNAYEATFPEVVNFHRKLEDLALRRKAEDGEPWIRTNYGRRLSLMPGGGEYMLVNYLIQGTAADVLKDAMVQLDLAGLSKYLLLPVHDELVFDIPRSEIDELEPEIIETMTFKDRFACPLTVDAKRVDRWGDKYR
jgi:DNA polymerase-1